MMKFAVLLALVAFAQAGVPLGYGAAPAYGLAAAPAYGVAVAAAPAVHEKTTVLANSAPGTGGHAPNNLITLLRSGDGGYVPGEEPDPPVIQRPSSTVYRSDDTLHAGVVGVGHHGEAIHAGRPFTQGYINRNEHGGSYEHHEKADAGNRRTGSYGFTGADGTYRRVDYVADEHGYRAKVSTNEQGTASHAAADALTVAEKPPYLQYSPPAAPVAQVVKAAPILHAAPVLHAAPTYGIAHAAPSYGIAHAAPSYGIAHAAPSYGIAHAAPVYAAAHPAIGLHGVGAYGGLGLNRGIIGGGLALNRGVLGHGIALNRGVIGHGLALNRGIIGGGLIQAPGIVSHGGFGLAGHPGGLVYG